MHVIWLHQKADFQVHKYGGGGKKLSTVAVQIFTYQFITLDVQFFLYSRVGSCVVLSQIIGSFMLTDVSSFANTWKPIILQLK